MSLFIVGFEKIRINLKTFDIPTDSKISALDKRKIVFVFFKWDESQNIYIFSKGTCRPQQELQSMHEVQINKTIAQDKSDKFKELATTTKNGFVEK